MTYRCLERQSFDSDAFGVDFFRVRRFEPMELAGDLAELRRLPRVMADAKIPASDRDLDRFLQGQGFRKVSVQLRFEAEATTVAASGDPEATVANRLSPEAVERHIKNLVYDRFNLDAFVPAAARDRFQRAWIGNSLASPSILKVYAGESFVSVKTAGEDAVVDIVSVLDKRRGIGSALLGRVAGAAKTAGCRRVLVLTEAENLPACLLYQKNGFRLEAAFSCFHLVKL